MKRWKGFLILMLVCMLTETNAAASMSAKWDYDYAANPPCSTTVTANCVSGFELSHLAGATKVIDAVANNPASPTGLVTGITTTFNVTGVVGVVTFTMTPVTKDSAGTTHADGKVATAQGNVQAGAVVNFQLPQLP